MKRLACIVVLGLVGLVGCGGGSGDDDDDISFPVDASTGGQPDGGNGDTCNTVSQTGCQPGEKCSYIIDQLDPRIGHVGCTPEGTDQIGDACTAAETVGTSDSCAKGGYCYNETCREICTTLNDQCASGQCGDFVDSQGNPLPIEWCLFGCDPTLQDCASENESCYLSDGEGICLRRVQEYAVGEACTYTNDCAEGGQCFGDPGVCRQLCGTIDQMWGTDMDGLLTWPTCCGTNCTEATKPCALPKDMCWLVSDGADGVANYGICLTDEESSNPDATSPWTCDCNSTETEKCSLDNP